MRTSRTGCNLDEADWDHRLRAAQDRGWEAVLVSAAKGTGLDALGAALSNGANRGPT
jgi:hypothetical protein